MLCNQSLQAQHIDAEVFILDLLISRFLFLPRGYPGHNSEGHLFKIAGNTCQKPWDASKIYLTSGHLSNGLQSETAVHGLFL